MWVEMARALEQLGSGRLSEPLPCQHQGDLFTSARQLGEDRKRLVRRAGADDPITTRVAVAQLSFDLAERRLNVDGQEDGRQHASLNPSARASPGVTLPLRTRHEPGRPRGRQVHHDAPVANAASLAHPAPARRGRRHRARGFSAL